jgi:hypothetical protein
MSAAEATAADAISLTKLRAIILPLSQNFATPSELDNETLTVTLAPIN